MEAELIGRMSHHFSKPASDNYLFFLTGFLIERTDQQSARNIFFFPTIFHLAILRLPPSPHRAVNRANISLSRARWFTRLHYSCHYVMHVAYFCCLLSCDSSSATAGKSRIIGQVVSYRYFLLLFPQMLVRFYREKNIFQIENL